MKTWKKFFFAAFLLFICISAYSIEITSCFGIYYRTPYEKIKQTLTQEGFKIIDEKKIKDSSVDAIAIYVSSFEYEKIPYGSATFYLQRDIDGKYYLSHAQGVVDANKVVDNSYYKSNFNSFISDLSEKYQMEDIRDQGAYYYFFYGTNNDSFINIQISEIGDKSYIIVSYFPKNKSW